MKRTILTEEHDAFRQMVRDLGLELEGYKDQAPAAGFRASLDSRLQHVT